MAKALPALLLVAGIALALTYFAIGLSCPYGIVATIMTGQVKIPGVLAWLAYKRILALAVALVLYAIYLWLRGVNDDAQTLEALMRAFVECRIKPYYLHHADLAPGTSHFRTTIEQGQALMRALRGRVSGLAQPAYVLDIPGGFGKVPVGPGYLDMCGDAGAVVEDIAGVKHRYRSPD